MSILVVGKLDYHKYSNLFWCLSSRWEGGWSWVEYPQAIPRTVAHPPLRQRPVDEETVKFIFFYHLGKSEDKR